MFLFLFLTLFQTPEQFEQKYLKRLQMEQYKSQNLTEFILSGAVFDAVWAMCLGLHNVSERVRMNDSSGCNHLPGELVPLERFHYLNNRMGCVLRKSFQQVSFRGITVSHCSCNSLLLINVDFTGTYSIHQW